MKKKLIHTNLIIIKYFLVVIATVFFFCSCKMNLNSILVNKNLVRKKKVTMGLEVVVNPEQLKSMLKVCDDAHFKFYEEKCKYVEYIKRSNGITLSVSSPLDIIIFRGDHNICFFEDRIIFIDKNPHDDNIFKPQERDTTLELYYYDNQNTTFCYFDSLYNMENEEKLELEYFD